MHSRQRLAKFSSLVRCASASLCLVRLSSTGNGLVARSDDFIPMIGIESGRGVGLATTDRLDSRTACPVQGNGRAATADRDGLRRSSLRGRGAGHPVSDDPICMAYAHAFTLRAQALEEAEHHRQRLTREG